MGKIWMPGGGGGADLDLVTAVAPDVLAGKVIVDKDGNPLTGTMPVIGAVNQSLGVNSTYTIPEGYHNGQGKVTQNLATMAAQTINPTASQQIVSSSGKYMTGNVTVNGVSNLMAANIKKGVNVGGTVGTFEGYVPTVTDLYLRGNNIAGWTYAAVGGDTGAPTFQAGQIDIGNTTSIETAAVRSLVGYKYFNIEGYSTKTYTRQIKLYYGTKNDPNNLLITYNAAVINGSYTYSLDLTTSQVSGVLRILLYDLGGQIFRIWLS